ALHQGAQQHTTCIFCGCNGSQVLEIYQTGAAKIEAYLGDPDRRGHYDYYYETSLD
ncbi:MAG: hypothetical protein CG446_279, partial [Methanosaeta sp. ASO1]